jgi:hypothetical protein
MDTIVFMIAITIFLLYLQGLAPCSQHAPVHKSVVAFKTMRGKIGVDFDLIESSGFQEG